MLLSSLYLVWFTLPARTSIRISLQKGICKCAGLVRCKGWEYKIECAAVTQVTLCTHQTKCPVKLSGHQFTNLPLFCCWRILTAIQLKPLALWVSFLTRWKKREKLEKEEKKKKKKGAKQQRIAVQNDLRSTRNTKTLRLDRRLNREEFKKNDDNQVDLEYTEYKKINRKVLEVLAGHFASCIRPVLYLEFSFLTKAAFALSIKASSSPLCSHMS